LFFPYPRNNEPCGIDKPVVVCCAIGNRSFTRPKSNYTSTNSDEVTWNIWKWKGVWYSKEGEVQSSSPVYIHIRTCKPSVLWVYMKIHCGKLREKRNNTKERKKRTMWISFEFVAPISSEHRAHIIEEQFNLSMDTPDI
jgi:hypothetical protein